MINVKEKAHLNGKMVVCTRESGRMENNTALVFLRVKIIKSKEVNGRMAKRLNGWNESI